MSYVFVSTYFYAKKHILAFLILSTHLYVRYHFEIAANDQGARCGLNEYLVAIYVE